MKTSKLIVIVVALAVLCSICPAQNPLNIELIGQGAFDGRFLRYTAFENYLYILTSKTNPTRFFFTAVDISIPTHPDRLGLIAVENNSIFDLIIADSLLIQSMNNGGAVIYSIQNPAIPIETARFNDDRGFWDMKMYNGYVVSRRFPGLNIIDIQNPQDPFILASIQLQFPATISDFDFYEHYFVLTESDNFPFDGSYLEIYDVSDLPSPELIYHTTIDTLYSLYQKVKVVGDHFYLLEYYGVSVYSLSDPYNPTFIHGALDNYRFNNMAIRGDRLFGLTVDSTLVTIDIIDPANPVVTGEFNAQLYPDEIIISDSFLYYSSANRGISFLDYSNPDSLRLEGRYIPGSGGWGIAKRDSLVYFADNAGGFRVINAADPLDPVGVNFYLTDQQTHNIYINDNLLFLADNYDGVKIFSLTDPLNPELLSTVFTASNVQNMRVQGNYLFIANSDDGFRIVDITDPQNPSILSHYSANSNYRMAIYPHGAYLFVAERGDGLCVYDISDLTNPVLITCNDDADFPHDLFLVGNTLYVADYGNGLLIFDVASPSYPILEGTGACDQAFAVCAESDIAYIADRMGGVKAFDVANPNSPQLIGTFNDGSCANKICIENDTVYVATGYGLKILRYDETLGLEEIAELPEELYLAENYPDPFNAQTIIRFILPKSQNVELAIYDLLGRQVDVLINEYREAGVHTITFDGSSLSSGVYFYRLRAGDAVETKRMVLLK